MKKIYSLLLIGILIVGVSTGYAADKNPAPKDNTEFLINPVESVTIDNVINSTFESPAVNMELKNLITNDFILFGMELVSPETKDLKPWPYNYTTIGNTLNKHSATKYTIKRNRNNKTDYVYMC